MLFEPVAANWTTFKTVEISKMLKFTAKTNNHFVWVSVVQRGCAGDAKARR